MATTAKPRRTRGGAARLALAAMLLLAPVAWALGELSQKSGTAPCVSEDGSGGVCQNGKALRQEWRAFVHTVRSEVPRRHGCRS
jgi:hypothetical protein